MRSRAPVTATSFSTTLAPNTTPPSRAVARPSTVPAGVVSARPPPVGSRHSPRMDEDTFDYYEDYYYDYQSPG